MQLAEKILALRKDRGMSQEDLAASLGVTRQTVSRWEVGSAQPDAENLLQLSLLFDVSADYLLRDSEAPESGMESDKGIGHVPGNDHPEDPEPKRFIPWYQWPGFPWRVLALLIAFLAIFWLVEAIDELAIRYVLECLGCCAVAIGLVIFAEKRDKTVR